MDFLFWYLFVPFVCCSLFFIRLRSYRRKRLMDAIMTNDYEGMRKLVEKAVQFKELADQQRAQMISEHLWITTKVAGRVSRAQEHSSPPPRTSADKLGLVLCTDPQVHKELANG